jgi:hypothetical protein
MSRDRQWRRGAISSMPAASFFDFSREDQLCPHSASRRTHRAEAYGYSISCAFGNGRGSWQADSVLDRRYDGTRKRLVRARGRRRRPVWNLPSRDALCGRSHQRVGPGVKRDHRAQPRPLPLGARRLSPCSQSQAPRPTIHWCSDGISVACSPQFLNCFAKIAGL